MAGCEGPPGSEAARLMVLDANASDSPETDPYPYTLEATSETVRESLVALAENLCDLANDSTLPPAFRSANLRYAPFLTEMSNRKDFCKRLAETDISPEMTDREIVHQMAQPMAAWQLPNKRPYRLTAWVDLLTGARLGRPIVFMKPGHDIFSWLGDHFEVQFVYGGSIGQAEQQPDKFPIVQATGLRLPRELTEQQAARQVSFQLKVTFQRFIRAVQPLAFQTLLPGFSVRVFAFEYASRTVVDEDGTTRITILNDPPPVKVRAAFHVSLRRGQRKDPLLMSVAKKVAQSLSEDLKYSKPQGRRPSNNSTREVVGYVCS